jgi:hypothetical protein
MKRFLTVVAATAAAAAVAAAISLPAGADDPGQSTDAQFVTCLRAHGAGVPAGARGAAIKTWVIGHEDAAVGRAATACKREVGSSPAPEQLVACLRDHGLTPPATIEDLKPWIVRELGTDAGKAALRACDFDTDPPDKAPAAPGADKRVAVCGEAAKAKR